MNTKYKAPRTKIEATTNQNQNQTKLLKHFLLEPLPGGAGWLESGELAVGTASAQGGDLSAAVAEIQRGREVARPRGAPLGFGLWCNGSPQSPPWLGLGSWTEVGEARNAMGMLLLSAFLMEPVAGGAAAGKGRRQPCLAGEGGGCPVSGTCTGQQMERLRCSFYFFQPGIFCELSGLET